jgi:hypothetical protein
MPVPSQKPVLKILNRNIWNAEKIPERIKAVDTRYPTVPVSRFTPDAPTRMIGGVTTISIISHYVYDKSGRVS